MEFGKANLHNKWHHGLKKDWFKELVWGKFYKIYWINWWQKIQIAKLVLIICQQFWLNSIKLNEKHLSLLT